MIFGFIQAHRNEFRVSKMCEVLGVSKSGFYQWLKHAPTPQQERKAQLNRQIKKIHKQSKARYGSPKITRMLWKEGTVVSERTVSRLMKEMGIRSKVVKNTKRRQILSTICQFIQTGSIRILKSTQVASSGSPILLTFTRMKVGSIWPL